MTAEEFKKLLEDHDWNYRHSDDRKIWKKGKTQEMKILNYRNKNPELYGIYLQFIREKVKDE